MDKNQQGAWETFCSTGRIEDYLAYRRQEPHNAPAKPEEADSHATDSRGNRPPSIQG